MIELSQALADHLEGPQTTLCSCWVISRQDGRKLGFTDHDKALTVDGVLCEPETGFTGGSVEQSGGLNADSWSADGILSSDTISDQDLRAGLYDRAIIEQWLVNWRNPAQSVRITRALMGEATLHTHHYTIELRSITALLDRDQTRFFTIDCDAELGDQRCGVNVDELAVDALLVAHGVNNSVTLDLSASVKTADFCEGTLVALSGAIARINHLTMHASGQSAEVFLDRVFDVQPGQAVVMRPGCDKRFSTCRTRFSNALNFRGFPHIPGGENALNYADEEGVYNGEPLVR